MTFARVFDVVFDKSANTAGLISLALQFAQFFKSSEFQPLASQWEKVSKYLDCQVLTQIENNKLILGDVHYANFKKDCNDLQFSANGWEEKLDTQKLSKDEVKKETRRAKRAMKEAKKLRSEVITTSRSMRGESSQIKSFSSNIDESEAPSMARVVSRRSHQVPIDEEAALESSGSSVTGSPPVLSPRTSSPENNLQDLPLNCSVQLSNLTSPDANIYVQRAGSDIEFLVTYSNGNTSTFSGKEILRNPSLIPKEIMFPLMELAQNILNMRPQAEKNVSPISASGEADGIESQSPQSERAHADANKIVCGEGTHQ